MAARNPTISSRCPLPMFLLSCFKMPTSQREEACLGLAYMTCLSEKKPSRRPCRKDFPSKHTKQQTNKKLMTISRTKATKIETATTTTITSTTAATELDEKHRRDRGNGSYTETNTPLESITCFFKIFMSSRPNRFFCKLCK